ncbi:uncharacterized protein LOC129889134 [Solanum dulcamara]|uniref:uncharacterized protein LOC129889134 n=1 Tax=Solanum dulcamara TaxID=45834 RepID=UPI002486B841|nr:uncharacterized protein LOC129889134 [Solanum dulcamara]
MMQVPVVGNSEGIVILWYDSQLELDDIATSIQEIHTMIKVHPGPVVCKKVQLDLNNTQQATTTCSTATSEKNQTRERCSIHCRPATNYPIHAVLPIQTLFKDFFKYSNHHVPASSRSCNITPNDVLHHHQTSKNLKNPRTTTWFIQELLNNTL